MYNLHLKARYPWFSPWGYLSLPPAPDAPSSSWGYLSLPPAPDAPGSLLLAISVSHPLSAFLPSLPAPGLWSVPWISLHSIFLGYLGTSVLSVNQAGAFCWNSLACSSPLMYKPIQSRAFHPHPTAPQISPSSSFYCSR